MGSVLGRRLVDAEGTEGDAAASPSRAPEQRDLQSCLDDAGKAVVEELRSANIEDIKEAITIYEDLGYDVHLGRVEFVEVRGGSARVRARAARLVPGTPEPAAASLNIVRAPPARRAAGVWHHLHGRRRRL